MCHGAQETKRQIFEPSHNDVIVPIDFDIVSTLIEVVKLLVL